MSSVIPHYMPIGEAISQFVLEFRDTQVMPRPIELSLAIIESALCEALNRQKICQVYCVPILSPDEDATASRLSPYFDSLAFIYLTGHMSHTQSGLISIRSVAVISYSTAIIVQEL